VGAKEEESVLPTSTETQIPTPTLTPTVTPVPTATLSPTPAPTPTVLNILNNLPDDFAGGIAESHLPYDELVMSINPQAKVIVIPGSTGVAYSIPNETCNDFTVKDGIALYYILSKRAGQSFAYVGPLIDSESLFIFFENRGNGCQIIRNNLGAPAFCASQIYQPKGWGGTEMHTEFNLYPPEENGWERYSLQDPVYCAIAGLKVFALDMEGNSVMAAANYKGYHSVTDPDFVANYMPPYNMQHKVVGGQIIPFSNDIELERLLAPEITEMEKLVDSFYELYPDFYFGTN